MLLYAEEADLVPLWLSAAPANVTTLLRLASGLVGAACTADLYATDVDGKPVDGKLADAMRDATCAQVSLWSLAGIDPAAGGVGKSDPVAVAKSMGSRSVTYADLSSSVTVASARSEAATRLGLEARMILQAAGLMSGQPVSI